MTKEYALYRYTFRERYGAPEQTNHVLVRVMARAEGYAMVRRRGAAPFVVSERDLARSTKTDEEAA